MALRRYVIAASCSIALLLGVPFQDTRAQEVPGCGDLENSYGPFDYRDPLVRSQKLRVVEDFHFTRDVQSLQRGASGSVITDLDYTLRAFPNHSRALAVMSKYALQGGGFLDTISSAECYFLRAVAFAPDDAAVHLLYGNYLYKRKKLKEAREEYEAAVRLDPQSPEISYNAGLYFLEVGEIERARELAKIAYDQDYPLPGLKNRLAAAEAAASSKKK
jgi:Tfp pilus assembly protein PilF